MQLGEAVLPSNISIWQRIVRGALALSLLAAVSVSLGACNTTAGVGQDVSATGQAVTKSAEKVKSGL